ncbi:DUF5818 domain-containing protein [Sphingobium naphthae]|jgi:hypothetical protein|uniref:DUF5818 domain-containing protein n=1 Tax=Sphingobium naphthae TaxID=1886786 RepID=UPI00374858FC
MPRGALHEEEGILLDQGIYPVLKIDEGGRWRLDTSCRYRHLVGQRVRVVGVRVDFDMLDVRRVDPA